MNKQDYTNLIRNYALELGFDACGFAKVGRLNSEAKQLKMWLSEKRNGTMTWMENNFEKRVDPTLLVPGAKTMVSLIASYHHPVHKSQIGIKNRPIISKYAQGRDYHKVLKKKLKELYSFTDKLLGGISGRCFVDSAPVLDKAWAARAGLGWVGKNSNLINKKIGSYFFIAEMIIDAELIYDAPTTDHCGSCRRCIDACPTGAIYEPYKVDGSKCISYLTIEHKGDINEDLQPKIHNWVFGCDICQDVCPWNSKATLASIIDFHPRKHVLEKQKMGFENIAETEFNTLFEGSAVKRATYNKFKTNVRIVERNLDKDTLQ